MESIELKVGWKRWLLMFGLNVAVITIVLIILTEHELTLTAMFITSFGAIVVTAVIMAVHSLFQRKVTLNADMMAIEGFSTKTISYKDIEKIQVGSGGITIYGNGHNVSITNLYKDFPEAIAFLKSKIDLQGVKIIWGRKEIPQSV
ncbi:MAG TPA: hypothetical protein VF181_06145 [Balneolaceae bacterium]